MSRPVYDLLFLFFLFFFPKFSYKLAMNLSVGERLDPLNHHAILFLVIYTIHKSIDLSYTIINSFKVKIKMFSSPILL